MISSHSGCSGTKCTHDVLGDSERARILQLQMELDDFIEADDLSGIHKCIDEGIDVTYDHGSGFTPVHIAAEHGSLNALKLLLDLDADVHAVDWSGRCPLSKALRKGHLPTARYLIEECRVSLNNHLFPPIICASMSRSDEALPTVQYLVQQTNADVESTFGGQTPLFLAKRLDVLEYLVREAGSNVNAVDFKGRTRLHQECSGETPPDLSRIRCLLEAGAVVTSKDASGNTPLLTLINTFVETDNYANGMEEDSETVLSVIRLLVEHGGTDIVNHTTSETGQTALHICCQDINFDIVRCLVEDCQADVNVTDNEGWTPLMEACTSFPTEQNTRAIEYLVNDAGANVLHRNFQGDTCIALCVREDLSLQLLQLLCDKTLAQAEATGTNCLHIFKEFLVMNHRINFDYYSCRRFLTQSKLVEFLVKNVLGERAREIRNEETGDTVLHALFRDWVKDKNDLSNVVLCVVKQGNVDLLATNHDGLTALEMAERKCDIKSVKTMKSLQRQRIWEVLRFLNSANWFPQRTSTR